MSKQRSSFHFYCAEKSCPKVKPPLKGETLTGCSGTTDQLALFFSRGNQRRATPEHKNTVNIRKQRKGENLARQYSLNSSSTILYSWVRRGRRVQPRFFYFTTCFSQISLSILNILNQKWSTRTAPRSTFSPSRHYKTKT